MLKIIPAAALAACIVYDVANSGLPTVVEAASPRGVKGDRLPIRPPALDCSQMGWSHSQGNCARSRMQPDDRSLEPREVRIVRLDRLSVAWADIADADQCDCHR